MARTAATSFFPDRTSAVPLHRQLAENLRAAIRSGELAAGSRVLASRALAAQLAISRNTVTQALDQLVAEGYLEARVGAGTFVAAGLARSRSVPVASTAIHLSARARDALALDPREPDGQPLTRAFRPGVPGIDLFPSATWRRMLARRLAQASTLDYDDAAGYRPLREAIAAYVRQTRGSSRGADHVFIVDGTQGALALAAHVLVDPGDTVLFEDPGYASGARAFVAAGARLAALPVDGDGAVITGLPAHARAAYVTPSHQYPTGAVMPVQRRLELLAWARTAGATIVEDDYDAEYRYDVETLPSLQALDDDGRVVYVGTLSKVLAPGLRLAYAIVPDGLVDAFAAVRNASSRGVALPLQAAAAEFVGEGQYALHVRRTTAAYRERRDALIRTLERRLGDRVSVHGAATGLHLLARLAPGDDDAAISRRILAAGVIAPALSAYAREVAVEPALILGFAATPPEAVAAPVDRLARAIEEWHRDERPQRPSTHARRSRTIGV